MAIATGYANSTGMALRVEARTGAGATTIVVDDVRFIQSNLGPQKRGDVLLTVDGASYTIEFIFTDDVIDQRTLQGHTKKRNQESAEN